MLRTSGGKEELSDGIWALARGWFEVSGVRDRVEFPKGIIEPKYLFCVSKSGLGAVTGVPVLVAIDFSFADRPLV
jgi:hypothetical protein